MGTWLGPAWFALCTITRQKFGFYMVALRMSIDSRDRIQKASVRDVNCCYALILVILVFTDLIFASVRAIMFGTTGARATKTMHIHLLDLIMCAAPTFLESNQTVRIVNRLSGDVEKIDSFVPTATNGVLEVLIIIFGALITVSWILPWFLIALSHLVGTFWLLQHWYVLSSKERKRLDDV